MKTLIRNTGLTTLCFWSVCTLWIGLSFTSKGYTQSAQAYVAQLRNEEGLKNAGFSILIENLTTGKTVAEAESHRMYMPASTQKLVTTLSALAVLGPDYTYKTQLMATGSFNEATGVLTGNLIIKGSGDPTLGSEKFDSTQLTVLLNKITRFLKSKNVRKIQGAIIGDGLLFGTEMANPGWSWGDIGNYYGAGPSGLTIHDNLYYAYFASGKSVGSPATLVRTWPDQSLLLELNNEVTTGEKGSGDNVYIFGSEYSNVRYLRGTIPAGEQEFPVKGSLSDPPYFAAWILTDHLKKEGIEVTEAPKTSRTYAINQAHLFTIGHIDSPPLIDIVTQINIYSNNLFAEHLHRTLGAHLFKVGSVKNGNQALEKTLIAAGVPADEFIVSDGSGLSRTNAISANALVTLLRSASQKPYFTSFLQSLPIAGESGTLKLVGKGTVLQGNMRAKSGSMNKIRSYAGFVTTKKEETLCFAVIFNHFQCSSSVLKNYIEKLIILSMEG